MHQEALEIKKYFFGEIYTPVVATLNNMAVLYVKQGLTKKSIPLIETSLSILKNALGPEHRKTKNVSTKLESLKSQEFLKTQSCPNSRLQNSIIYISQ